MVLPLVVSLPSQQDLDQRGEKGGRIHGVHALLYRRIYNYQCILWLGGFLGGNRRRYSSGIYRGADSVHLIGHRAARQIHAEGRAGKQIQTL